jgi:hypothetical protein
MTQTVSEAPAPPLGVGTVGRDERIHAPGRHYIGDGAYGGWALPPTAGGTAHRHVQGHHHMTAALTTSKQLVVQCFGTGLTALALAALARGGTRTAGQRRA